MNYTHVFAFVAGFVCLTALCCYGLWVGEVGNASDCLNYGKVKLDGRVFVCQEIAKEITP